MIEEVPTAALPFGDEAVRAKTGKTWAEWFALLDAADAAGMSHREIATYLVQEQGLPGWWAQSVTVAYERARGRRDVHQTCGGYRASSSKTIDVPLERLYEAWADESLRRRWLADPELTVRKATPSRSLRITRPDRTSLEVLFYPKGEGKSQVSLQHSKLADAAAVARSKAYWKDQLERLKALLQG